MNSNEKMAKILSVIKAHPNFKKVMDVQLDGDNLYLFVNKNGKQHRSNFGNIDLLVSFDKYWIWSLMDKF